MRIIDDSISWKYWIFTENWTWMTSNRCEVVIYIFFGSVKPNNPIIVIIALV
jgi:hypothetical protein